ncbi:MAG: hydrogenase iron-sulfur subunit [Proteobacteria bacterium]|nr:hydrogenase iron-sulfur subunit [Pseudomonadota bacterium]MBU1715471.1 hydrogenase iron-sulfur subunit [Pseudomonadota bacterium]
MNRTLDHTIVGFLCNWCSYAGADHAGGSQKSYPHNFKIIRVMCSGRVEPEFILEAFRKGAAGVVIMACHPGDCHYKTGNYQAAGRYHLLQKMISQLGIDENRLVMEYISASEGERFIEVVNQTVHTLEGIPPPPLS